MHKKGKTIKLAEIERVVTICALASLVNFYPGYNVTGKTITTHNHPNSTESEDNYNGTSSNSAFKVDDGGTKDAIVSRINCYRSCHSVPDLQRDEQIETSQSDAYAQQLGGSGSLQHSQSKYGENLYAGPNAEDCVDAWYFECAGNYNYGSNSNDFSCGHFTQLVWKSSERIGLGIATMSQYGYVVVANFDPAGNYQGEYTSNVLEPKGTCVSSCKSGGTGGGNGSGGGGADNGDNCGMGDGNNGGTGMESGGTGHFTTTTDISGGNTETGGGGNGTNGAGNEGTDNGMGGGGSGGGMGGGGNGMGDNGGNSETTTVSSWFNNDGWWTWGGGNNGNEGNGSEDSSQNQNSTNWGNNQNNGGTNCGNNDNCDSGGSWPAG